MRFDPYKIRMAISRPFLRRSGPIARLLNYPNLLKSRPCNRQNIDLARDGALGDVLMCTPVLRELKRRNPHCYIRFYTKYGPLVNGLAYIDEVLAFDKVLELDKTHAGVHFLYYEQAVPPEVHLSRIMGDKIGL